MVDVFLNSEDLNIAISWYVNKYGMSDTKPQKKEVILLHKLETMRDAQLQEELDFDKLTK